MPQVTLLAFAHASAAMGQSRSSYPYLQLFRYPTCEHASSNGSPL